MDDGQYVLDHFLLRAQAFLVHHDKVAVMDLAQVFDHLEAEAAEPVAVSHGQGPNAPVDNRIKDSQEVLAIEIGAATDFLDHSFTVQPFAVRNCSSTWTLLSRACNDTRA